MSASESKVLPPVQAFGMAITAYFLYTVGDTIGKWLQHDYGAPQILVGINIIGLVLMLGVAIKMRGFKNALKSEKWHLHALRSTIIAASTLGALVALKYLPLPEFYGIVFLNPVWVAIISCLFLGHKIPVGRWMAILGGFIGILIIAGSQFAHLNTGALIALGSSILSASAALLARHIGHEPPTNFSIATHTAMIVLNLPLIFLGGGFMMPTLADMGLMSIYGVTLSIAMLFIALVFSRSHVVSQVAPLQYTQMVWGVLVGWLVFEQPATMRIVIGSVLVMAAGIYILHSLRRGRLMNH